MRIAVVGTGISGSLAARLLASAHDVTVFEANDYCGGHANTVDVQLQGKRYPVDTGFMVFNDRTYPNFCRLLEHLDVPARDSDMSFSVHCPQTGFEYQGSSLNGLFAQRRNALRPSFWKMLSDILRFNRAGTQAAVDGTLRSGQTVGQFLAELNVGPSLMDHYLVPMAAAIWSSNPQQILDFPAQFLIGFFANHGLMQLRDRPQWRTIPGGSRNYVAALLEPLQECIRLNSPVRHVRRLPAGVLVSTDNDHDEPFDEVVFSCHADQALAMLADPTAEETEILSNFPYQANEAVLHTDMRLLPRHRRAWASWNYQLTAAADGLATVTYDLSRLQGHDSRTPILLSLNAPDVREECVIRSIQYEHPAYSLGSLEAQQRFGEVSGRQHTHYCGAYWGYGFHEDGVNSALRVAAAFDLDLDACTVASTKGTYATTAASR